MYSAGQWSQCLQTVLEIIYDKFGNDPDNRMLEKIAHDLMIVMKAAIHS